MVTASNLVFTGVMTGEFQALDADTGKILWSFQTPSGIVGQPITWEKDGKQYITVTSGIGGGYALKSGDPPLAKVPAGGTPRWVTTFSDGTRLPHLKPRGHRRPVFSVSFSNTI